jgi:hypothetical protein
MKVTVFGQYVELQALKIIKTSFIQLIKFCTIPTK